MISNNNSGYSLIFSQLLRRHIIAATKEQPLINRMAEIICLKPTLQNNLPKLIFTRSFPFSGKWGPLIRDSYKDHAAIFPDKNWQEADFNFLKVYTHKDVPDVVCRVPEKRNATCDLVILSFVYYQICRDLLSIGGLPLHGGLLERENRGVVLAGSSGSGKSTCCSRVLKPWKSICDDEVLVIPETPGAYKVHPVPTWSEYFFGTDSKSTWNVQKGFPFSALFFLEKSEFDKAVLLGQGRTAVKIYQSSMESFGRYFPFLPRLERKEISRKVFETACELAKNIPVFRLSCTWNSPFWSSIEREINRLNHMEASNSQ